MESGLSRLSGGSLLCGGDHRDALALKLQEPLAFLALPRLSGHRASHQLLSGSRGSCGPPATIIPTMSCGHFSMPLTCLGLALG